MLGKRRTYPEGRGTTNQIVLKVRSDDLVGDNLGVLEEFAYRRVELISNSGDKQGIPVALTPFVRKKKARTFCGHPRGNTEVAPDTALPVTTHSSDLVFLAPPRVFHGVLHDCPEQAGIPAELRLDLDISVVKRQVESADVFANTGASRNPAHGNHGQSRYGKRCTLRQNVSLTMPSSSFRSRSGNAMIYLRGGTTRKRHLARRNQAQA